MSRATYPKYLNILKKPKFYKNRESISQDFLAKKKQENYIAPSRAQE